MWFWRRRPVVYADARSVVTGRASVPTDQQRDFDVTADLGGFGKISFTWIGTSREDVRDSLLEWLHNDEEFADGLRFPNHRSLYVRFNGRAYLLTFRTDWVAGFTVR